MTGLKIAGLNPALWQAVPWDSIAERQRAAALQELLDAQMAPSQLPIPQMQSGPLVSTQEAGLAGSVALLARLFGARDQYVQQGLGGFLNTRSHMEMANRENDYQRQVAEYRQEMERMASAERAARERLRSAERFGDRLDTHRREEQRHQRQMDLQSMRDGQAAERAQATGARNALFELLRGARTPEQIAAARASGAIALPDEAWDALLSAAAQVSGAAGLGPADPGMNAGPDSRFIQGQEPELHPALERVLTARSVRDQYADAARANAAYLPAERRVEAGSVWVFIDQNERKHEAAMRIDDRGAMAAHDRDLKRHLEKVNSVLKAEIEKDLAKVRALRARPNAANDAQATRLESAIAARQSRILANLEMFASRLGATPATDYAPLDPFSGQHGILPTLPKLGQPSGSPSLSGPIR